MRKVYVYDERVGKLVPKEEYIPPSRGPMVMPDIPDFVSPVDGSVVHGRRSLREHNLRHNVTNVADFKETWEKQSRERDRAFMGNAGYDSERRKEAIARSMEKLRGRR